MKESNIWQSKRSLYFCLLVFLLSGCSVRNHEFQLKQWDDVKLADRPTKSKPIQVNLILPQTLTLSGFDGNSEEIKQFSPLVRQLLVDMEPGIEFLVTGMKNVVIDKKKIPDMDIRIELKRIEIIKRESKLNKPIELELDFEIFNYHDQLGFNYHFSRSVHSNGELPINFIDNLWSVTLNNAITRVISGSSTIGVTD